MKLNKEKDEEEMKMRHENTIKEFKSEQSKENLQQQGKFTSRGGNMEKASTVTRLKSQTLKNSKKF